MVLRCCKCEDVTDWKDIKKWNEENKFYCPNCIDTHKIIEVELDDWGIDGLIKNGGAMIFNPPKEGGESGVSYRL